jgi:drug/metabolite transporter (DMT)-like permease
MSDFPSHLSSPASKTGFDGFGLGFLGILCFSCTLPATRVAVASFDPMVVGFGRAVVAACVAAPVLFFTKQSWPSKAQWRGLAWVSIGIVAGFSILTAYAMRRVPASHGAVVLGILPMLTAVVATLQSKERPSLIFWCASAVGSGTVITYALSRGAGGFQAADMALIAAAILGAFGYAEGGRLARQMGGWQVISWGVVLAFPFLIGPVGYAIWKHGLSGPPSAWFGLGYVCFVSMYLSFFAWYRALAKGGIARVSQIQLLQPFLTLSISGLLLGEKLGLGAFVCAAIVATSILVGKNAASKRV